MDMKIFVGVCIILLAPYGRAQTCDEILDPIDGNLFGEENQNSIPSDYPGADINDGLAKDGALAKELGEEQKTGEDVVAREGDVAKRSAIENPILEETTKISYCYHWRYLWRIGYCWVVWPRIRYAHCNRFNWYNCRPCLPTNYVCYRRVLLFCRPPWCRYGGFRWTRLCVPRACSHRYC